MQVIAATIAFGMELTNRYPVCDYIAIFPKSIEIITRETGHAGRDMAGGTFILYYSHKDVSKAGAFDARQTAGVSAGWEPTDQWNRGLCRRQGLPPPQGGAQLFWREGMGRKLW